MASPLFPDSDGARRTTGPHLHFAVFVDGRAVDPLERLRSVPMAFSDTTPGIVFGYGE